MTFGKANKYWIYVNLWIGMTYDLLNPKEYTLLPHMTQSLIGLALWKRIRVISSCSLILFLFFLSFLDSTYVRLLLLLVNIIEGLGQYFNKVPSSCSSTTVDSGGNIDDIITGVDPIKVSPQSKFQWRMLNAQQLFSKRRRNGRKEIDCKVLW